MKPGRLDALLLVGVGVLLVHELAYLPSALGASVAADGISHADAPALWAAGSVLGVLALARVVVTSLRSRRRITGVDPVLLGSSIAGIYVLQEVIERHAAGSSAPALLVEWALWLGLAAVPMVAVALSRLVGSIADALTAVSLGHRPRAARQALTVAVSVVSFPWPALPAHALSRRGPPVPDRCRTRTIRDERNRDDHTHMDAPRRRVRCPVAAEHCVR